MHHTLVLSLTLLIVSSATAFARCERSHIAWRYGQSVSSVWHTDGAVCTDVPREHQFIAAIRISDRPKHGVLGKAGTFGLAYKPDPGFKGTDTLSFAFVSNGTGRAPARSPTSALLSSSSDDQRANAICLERMHDRG